MKYNKLFFNLNVKTLIKIHLFEKMLKYHFVIKIKKYLFKIYAEKTALNNATIKKLELNDVDNEFCM